MLNHLDSGPHGSPSPALSQVLLLILFLAFGTGLCVCACVLDRDASSLSLEEWMTVPLSSLSVSWDEGLECLLYPWNCGEPCCGPSRSPARPDRTLRQAVGELNCLCGARDRQVQNPPNLRHKEEKPRENVWRVAAPGHRGHRGNRGHSCGSGGWGEEGRQRPILPPGLGMIGSGGIALQEELKGIGGVILTFCLD